MYRAEAEGGGEMICTKISMELLLEIEQKSAVRWAGGERPTDYTILKEFPFLVLEKDGLCHAYPSGVARPTLSDSEFLAACIKAKPKDTTILGLILRTDTSKGGNTPKEAAMKEIKIGDRVRVVKKVTGSFTWVAPMYRSLGQIGTVERIVDTDTRCVKLDNGERWFYPRDALQLVDGPAQLQPKIAEPSPITPCPHPEWLGVWLTRERMIREVTWVEGFWRIYHKTNDYVPGRTKHDSNWTIPVDWTRPTNGPRLPRPKQRARVRVGWDPEDMG